MKQINILLALFVLILPAFLPLEKVGEEKEYYASIQKSELDGNPELGDFIIIDHPKEKTLTIYFNNSGLDYLNGNSIPFDLLTPPGKILPPSELKMGNPLPLWDSYPSYQEYLDLMQMMSDSFPSICQKIEIGNSVNGKKLLFLKISDNVGTDEAEPEFMYSSTMHGNETAGYVFCLRLAWELLNNYGPDPKITRLVDSLEIFINPLFNPDGTYALSDTSIWGATRFNANGFDLNRNFPDPKNGMFPGGARQIETQYMMDFMAGKHIHFSANFHAGAEVMNYPWDTWSQRHADDLWFINISKEYADTAQSNSPPGYMSGFNDGIINGYDWYPIAGGRQDYTTYFLRGREITVELSNAKVLPGAQLPAYYSYNEPSLINYLEQALYGIQGLVTDSATGLPIKARINIPNYDKDQSSVFSDSALGFYVRYLDSGIYDLEFSSPGYQNKTVSAIRVDRLKKSLLNVALSPGITGTVSLAIEKIKIWPNPSTGLIFISNPIGKNEGLSIEIFEFNGKKIPSRVTFSGKENSIMLDLRNERPGIYYARININDEQIIRKILITP
jgi:Zinc carboxypeptidase/Secretion system C-terminal sorting domain